MQTNSSVRIFFTRMSLLLMILLSYGLAQAAETHKIQGNVLDDQQKPVDGAVVVLMKIVMQGQPSISPLKQTQSDEQGRYEFIIEPSEASSFFRIEVKGEKSMTSSEPFKFKTGQFLKLMQLILPAIREGLAHLDFSRDILVVDAMESALRITEIIRFSNASNVMVSVDREPYLKRIPAEAENFQFFKRQDQFEATRKKDKIRFKLLVPPGDHQLYFSYDLPVKKRSIVLLNHLPPQTEEMEVIVSVNSLNLSFDKQSQLASSRVVKQVKRFSDRHYDSQTLFLEKGQREISIVIKNIPISRERFVYPVILLAVLLFVGLSFFLIKRSKPTTKKS